MFYPYDTTAGTVAVQAARRTGLDVTFNKHGLPMVQGMRADFWLRLKDRPVTEFRGAQVVKS